jgi:hypothetical protein
MGTISSCDTLGLVLVIFISSCSLYSLYLYILVNSHFKDKTETGWMIWSWLFDGSKLDDIGKKNRIRWIFVSMILLGGGVVYIQLIKVAC